MPRSAVGATESPPKRKNIFKKKGAEVGRGVERWGKVLYSPIVPTAARKGHEGPLSMFLGEYEHSLDAKQRLAIPSEVRDAWRPERHGEAFVAAPGQNGALWLWPEKKFEEQADRIESGLVTQEEVVRFNRDLFPRAARVPFDSAGRVRIPDRLLNDFGLSGTVVILGVRDHLELATVEERERERQLLRAKRPA